MRILDLGVAPRQRTALPGKRRSIERLLGKCFTPDRHRQYSVEGHNLTGCRSLIYILTYDLITPGQDYSSLYTTLQAFNAVRVQDSAWAFRRYNTSAGGLLGYFRQYVDINDRLLVVSVGEWSSINAYSDINSA